MSEYSCPVKRIRLDSSTSESGDLSEDDSDSISSLSNGDVSIVSSQENSTDYTEDSELESERSEPPEPIKELEDTPLHKAVAAADINLIEEILDSGVDIDAPGERNFTALHLAINNKYLPGIKCLLEYGASISATDGSYPYINNHGNTPLHFAVEEDRLDIVKMLFTIQVDINKLMKNYDKVLSHALKRGNYKIIKSLVGFSLHEDDNLKRRAFNLLSRQKLRMMGYNDNVIDSLFDKYVVVNSESDGTPLLLAVKNRNLDMVEFLLNAGSDINASTYYRYKHGWTALHEAIHINDEDIVEFLLKKEDCDFNLKKNEYSLTPLEVAASSNHLKMVQKLVDKIFHHDKYGTDKFKHVLKAFHIAIKANFVEIAKYFLDTVNIDVNMITENGESALGVAIYANQVGMAELLLNSGANINYYSEYIDKGFNREDPPLYRAVQNGSLLMVDLLLSRGARIEEEKFTKTTILHLAVSSKNNEVVKRVLDLGVDVHCKRETYPYGNVSPLLLAIHLKVKDIVLTLIEHGCNINDKTIIKGKCVSSIDIALKRGNNFLIMLLDLGADINNATINVNKLPENTLKILERHVFKLKAARLFVDQKFDAWISRAMEGNRFYKKCRKEVKKMKEEKFYQLTICYYDLLSNNVNRVAMYSKNETINNVLELDQLKIKFPLYAEMLRCNLKRGQRRNQLLESTARMFEDILIGLPYDCVIQILRYLSDDDLLKSLGKLSDNFVVDG